MALIFKFDPEQFQMLVTAIDNLSSNLAKWQGAHTEAIKDGFGNLVETLGGEDVQEKIDQITLAVRTVKEKLKSSVDSQMKETE